MELQKETFLDHVININKGNVEFTGFQEDNPISGLFDLEKEYVNISQLVSAYNYVTSIVKQCKDILKKEPFLSKTITQKVQIIYKALENNFKISQENSLLLVPDIGNMVLGCDKVAFLTLAIIYELNIHDIYIINLPNHTIIHADGNHIDLGEIKSDSYYIKKYKIPSKQIETLFSPIDSIMMKANFYFNLGKYMYYKQNVEIASKSFTTAININSCLIEAFYYRGLCKSLLPMQIKFEKSSNLTYGYIVKLSLENQTERLSFDSAIIDFTKVIKLYSSNHMALFSRGMVNNYIGKFQDAIADYSEVIKLLPSFSEAWLQRSLVKYQTNDLIGAENDFQQIIQLEPNKGDIWFNYAIIKFGSNNIIEGLKYLKKAANLQSSLFKVQSPCNEISGREDRINNTNFESIIENEIIKFENETNKDTTYIEKIISHIKTGQMPTALKLLININSNNLNI